jgi:3-amino-4-hydroxybenzoic acid synthase
MNPGMKLCWLDVRGAGDLTAALCAEAVHHRFDAVVAADLDVLSPLPPTVRKVYAPGDGPLPEDVGPAEVVIVDPLRHGDPAELAKRHPGVAFGRTAHVLDADSLAIACHSARTEAWTVLRFQDPTKIPLEIVLAAAAGGTGKLITIVDDPVEAGVVLDVLEHGPDGVLMAPRTLADVSRLRAATETRTDDVPLVELEVVRTVHLGRGERACVDTCSYLRPDEGLLVGSRARGMILCVSETHPLPYMPTRPFRVNAGAIMSYTLSADGRTNYLSELRAGSRVLAVDVRGHSRLVSVGRVKVETRPLLSIDAVTGDGQEVNLIVQDDWHVRVLGPGGAVLNSTSLAPGDRLLGYVATKDRHVGYPIDEFCAER